ncbi:hypothetical protein [Pseudoxanthomonas composti]|uniref:hypothetical protein n=1 Tax=Pseudoxanthomonas composti TaxID=2137479 RepID=UPI001F50D373|nr:hypothetical protein [Pseudoxanthomonas composti]
MNQIPPPTGARLPAALGRSLRRLALAALLATLVPATAGAQALQFRIDEGATTNAFYQDGPVAAHVLATSGTRPRLLVAFPAGNSGVAVWFAQTAAPVQWTLKSVRAQTPSDDKAMHGIVAELELRGGPLTVDKAALGSIRVLRDVQLGQPMPAQVVTEAKVEAQRIGWARRRLDGAPGYRIALEVTQGRLISQAGTITLAPERPDGSVRLRLLAATGEAPLTPLSAGQLLNEKAASDARMRSALQFLSYREKFLAGSWRFDTYFGRDTLMSTRLLMPVLQPEAVEAGLGAVLARLSPRGKVAHEEDIGEFAILRHLASDGARSDAPVYDYGMIDGDYMLAPVMAAWLVEDTRGQARARAFLAARNDLQRSSNGQALLRNLLHVARSSEAFAAAPTFDHLLALKPGRMTGQWRDSEEGLGRGRYPFDVNVVWMPAALRAIGAFVDSGLLDDVASDAQRQTLRAAAARADAWERQARALFEVRLDSANAGAALRDYAQQLGVPVAPALDSLAGDGLTFPALSLDAGGRAVPVLHSDAGFDLLFGRPDPDTLAREVAAVMRPFPAGLVTEVGMVVANPVFADRATWGRLGPQAYHGTVVWAWQQAVMLAGLRRQLARGDLPAPVRTQLEQAQTRLLGLVKAAGQVRTSELWSWRWAQGRYRIEPFGAQGAHEDESNAAQLWSTVFLADPATHE